MTPSQAHRALVLTRKPAPRRTLARPAPLGDLRELALWLAEHCRGVPVLGEQAEALARKVTR